MAGKKLLSGTETRVKKLPLTAVTDDVRVASAQLTQALRI